MATEVGRLDFEAALRAAGPTRRMTIQAELHVLAFAQVWAQADRAGVTEPLALTRFLLERLYPEMRGERLEAIMARFAELKSAGRWDGPRRPEPLTGEGR